MDLANRLSELGYALGQPQISRIERGVRSVSVEDFLALAAALDCSPFTLLAPLKDEELVRVTAALPPARAETIRKWAVGYPQPLRIELGVVERNPSDVAAFLSQMPDSELRRTMQHMGLTEDEIEDGVSAVRTGVIPWPSGDPRIKEESNG